jgi:hypothetical protein
VSVIDAVPGARFRAVTLDARGDYVARTVVYEGAPLAQPAGVVVAP